MARPLATVTTAPVTFDAAVAAGEFCDVDLADGKADAISAANVGRIGLAMADAAIGDERTVVFQGKIAATNGKGSAVIWGELVAAKDATSVDAGSTGDRYIGMCIGPKASNADGTELHIWMDPAFGLVP